MKTFIYLLQFRLNIKHKLDKKYIISNILFRFFFDNEQVKKLSNFDNILNLNTFYNNIVNFLTNSNIYVFQKSLITIFDNFRKQIINNYIKKNLTKYNSYVEIVNEANTNQKKITIQKIVVAKKLFESTLIKVVVVENLFKSIKSVVVENVLTKLVLTKFVVAENFSKSIESTLTKFVVVENFLKLTKVLIKLVVAKNLLKSISIKFVVNKL